MKVKAIALLSGGLDSAVASAIGHHQSMDITALSFFYHQRHSKELEMARKLANHYGWEHLVVELPKLEGSALTTPGAELKEIPGQLPTSFVPGRNLIFLAHAVSYAYIRKAVYIVGGWNVVDYSGYPDCRRSFLDAAEAACSLAVDKKIYIFAPLLHSNKSEIIKKGVQLGVPLQYTWSCYKGGERPCEECPSCRYRAKGFEEAGVEDPLL